MAWRACWRKCVLGGLLVGSGNRGKGEGGRGKEEGGKGKGSQGR